MGCVWTELCFLTPYSIGDKGGEAMEVGSLENVWKVVICRSG